jgi:hypothetical protein
MGASPERPKINLHTIQKVKRSLKELGKHKWSSGVPRLTGNRVTQY